MANFDKQLVEIQNVAGAAGSEVFAGVDLLTMPPVTVGAGVAQSLEMVTVVKFPTDFAGTPTLAKVWQSSGRINTGYTLYTGYSASYVTPVATASTIAAAAIEKELEDVYAAGYTNPAWDSTDKLIGYIYMQMSTAAGAGAFDSAAKARPLVVSYAFNRGDIQIADVNFGKGKYSSFAMLSEWNLFLVENGQEMLMGYVNNAFGLDELTEEAELMAGLPQSLIHSTVTKVGADLTGNFITFDPFVQTKLGHYKTQTETQRIVMGSYNKNIEVPKEYFILRGQTGDGFLLEIHIPKGQIYRDGSFNVGGLEYGEFGFKIKANVDDLTGLTHKFVMSQTPVQIENILINYSGV